MKCRVIASSVHPDKLSLRAMDGASVRDALKEAGFKDGDVVEIAFRRCIACSIEAEIGTEENPHPVPVRFHICDPL